jgi:hypothetical protein
MTTELRVEVIGFPSNEEQRLKSRWARLQFPAEFCKRFFARVDRGAAGEPGGIWVEANDDICIFTFAELDFSSVDDLVTKAEGFVKQFARRWKEDAGSKYVINTHDGRG